jgi:WD40 repeat protein
MLPEKVVEQPVHEEGYTCLCIAEGFVMSGGTDGQVHLFDSQVQLLKSDSHSHNGAVTSILIRKRMMVTASEDMTVRLFKLSDAYIYLLIKGKIYLTKEMPHLPSHLIDHY